MEEEKVNNNNKNTVGINNKIEKKTKIDSLGEEKKPQNTKKWGCNYQLYRNKIFKDYHEQFIICQTG